MARLLGRQKLRQRIDDLAIQVHVQHRAVKTLLRRRGHGIGQPADRLGGAIADRLQQFLHEHADHHLVFDQQQARSAWPCRARAGIVARRRHRS